MILKGLRHPELQAYLATLTLVVHSELTEYSLGPSIDSAIIRQYHLSIVDDSCRHYLNTAP